MEEGVAIVTVFFTSDLHLGSEGMAKWRRFPDVATHDEAILSNINLRVHPDDDLWLVGDLCKPNRASVRAMRESIRCRHVHLIVGNHDKRSVLETLVREEKLFEGVEYYAELGKVSKQGYKLCVSHYPMLDWNRAVYGAYMLHGHIHSLPAEGEHAVASGLPCVVEAMEGSPLGGSDGGMGMEGYNQRCRDLGIRRFDVGVDANGYAPVSVEEIMAYLPSSPTGRELLGTP